MFDGKTQNRGVLHPVRVRYLSSQNAVWRAIFGSLIAFALVLAFSRPVWAATTAPGSGSSPDSAAFLAQHQDDLGKFFAQHSGALLKESLPVLLSVAGNLFLVTALVGWLIDVPLSWGFSTIFAPAYGKFVRALIYASGRLVLALLFSVVLSFSALLGVNAGATLPALLVVSLLTVPAIVLQVCWVSYQYRTAPRPSLLFYCTLLLVHGLVLTILVPTVFASQVNGALTQAINLSVVPELQTEADRVQRAAAADAAKRDKAQAAVLTLQARIDQDHAQESDLQNRIVADKDAPAVIFSRLVLQRAQGDLADSGTGLADFIHRYPNDPHTGAARGELEAINQALKAQLESSREQQAATAADDARARARLLADVAAGHATLSEMRRALLGKPTADVAVLLGAPTDRAANRWGYGKRMILDSETNESMGLTIIFSEGLVQGVDYYYGSGQ